MERLKLEIETLVRKWEASWPTPGGTEAMTLNRLRELSAAVAKVQRTSELAPLFQDLEQYWLNSIDWCSQLSKDIERLLILQEELSTG